MADVLRGKVLFDQRIEYPLPQRAATRDYVFFVPNDGYASAAREFFKKFYPRHALHQIASLEELVSTLYTDVTQNGVQHIREVALVTHANSVGLLLPVLSQSSDPLMRGTTVNSLMCLQRRLADGALEAFNSRRTAVISHLKPDSWVTLRCCRFGLSQEGMYALYSFFGGNANVYAPIVYQFFGPQAVGPDAANLFGSRFPTRLRYHQHLVKQRFLPRDVHAPDRQDAIVKALADPGSFSEPFALATTHLDRTPPPEYAAIVDSLNRFKTSPELDALFDQHGFALSPKRRVSRDKSNEQWTISDVVAHPQLETPFEVHYTIGEVIDPHARTATLTAQAQVVNAIGANETVPLQLFLNEGEHDHFIGKLFPIAVSRDDDAADAPSRLRYEAYTGILKSNTNGSQNFGDGAGNDLRTEFQREGRRLSTNATIRQIPNPSAPPDSLEWNIWRIDDPPTSYLVKQEHPNATPRTRMHALTVYAPLAGRELEEVHYELSTWFGTDPDTPGVELVAYLDRLSTDDLVNMATYLRSPYKPDHAFYLHHILQAIGRKGNAHEFFQARFPDAGNTVLPSADALLMLSPGERDDLHAEVYPFEFQSYWTEVKASARSPIVFQTDLFKEEPLPKRLHLPAENLCDDDGLSLVADSPFTDKDEFKRIEAQGLNLFFATAEVAKLSASPLPEDEYSDCTDLKAALAKWKELQTLPVDQARDGLAAEHTPSGKSYLDIILELRSHYSFLRNMTKLTEFSKVIKLPKIPDPTDPYDMAKFVSEKVAKYVGWETAAEVLAEYALYELAFTVPMKMWLKFAEAQADAARAEKAKGKVTAIRQWLRALELYTFSRSFNEGDVLDNTDVTTPLGNDRYYITRYINEAMLEDSSESSGPVSKRHLQFPDSFGNGYDAGVLAVQLRVWPAIQKQTKQVVSDLLREANLDSCKVKTLNEAEFLDLTGLNARVIRAFARKLLDDLPRV